MAACLGFDHSSLSVVLLLLFLVTSDRMLARGQDGCPTSTDFQCACQQVVDAYVIWCYDNDTNIEPLSSLNLNSQSTGIVFRSLSFNPTIQLENLQASAFQGLRINQLNLNDLGIQNIHSLAFNGIGSGLIQLVLDDNSIDSLPIGIFNPLDAVQSISLSGNKIGALELGTFGGNLSLSLLWLSFSGNQIQSIPDMLFVSLTSLVGLWMDSNALTAVDDNTLIGLTNLVWLDLSNNSITSVSRMAFSDQSLLERIWLQDNQLIQLEPGLGGLSSVELLDLSYNSLSGLSTGDPQQVPASQFLYLGVSGNLWNCSCQLVDFLRVFSPVAGADSAICATPDDAVNTVAACYAPVGCTLPDSPTFCTLGTTALPQILQNGGKSNVGLIVGVVVGVLVVVLGVVAAGVAYYFIRQRRAQRGHRQNDFSNFVGGNDDADGSDSTTNLAYRLGGSRRFAGNPLFETNAKTMQATAAAKGGGGADEATENPSGHTADGSPPLGEQDVSVAAKTGLKVVINTNAATQNYTLNAKAGTDC